MHDGRHVLNTVTIGGNNYSLVCVKTSEVGFPQYFAWICKGDSQVPGPDIIAEAGINTTQEPDPITEVNRVIAELNNQLPSYFHAPLPVTWEEKIDSLIGDLSLRNEAGNQFVKERNWGADPVKSKWMSRRTGYTGDFGGGLFGVWCVANGFNMQDLINEYNNLGS